LSFWYSQKLKSPSGASIPEGNFFANCGYLCGQKYLLNFNISKKLQKTIKKPLKSEDLSGFSGAAGRI